MGHHLFPAEAVQPGIRADGSRPGEILLHELQPLQCVGIRHIVEQLVEDSSSDEEIPAVSELGGEQGETDTSSNSGEKQAERAEKLEDMGIAGMWDDMGGDREDATATVP